MEEAHSGQVNFDSMKYFFRLSLIFALSLFFSSCVSALYYEEYVEFEKISYKKDSLKKTTVKCFCGKIETEKGILYDCKFEVPFKRITRRRYVHLVVPKDLERKEDFVCEQHRSCNMFLLNHLCYKSYLF